MLNDIIQQVLITQNQTQNLEKLDEESNQNTVEQVRENFGINSIQILRCL